MGLYFRKSVRVGPLRFNFSKSGIGVSAGIPGFRVGSGPRGNYVHMGRGGIYYRATLPSAPRAERTGSPTPAYRQIAPSDPTLGPETAIDSGSVLAMVDESAAGLLAELNEKRRRVRIAPPVAIVLAFVLMFSWNALQSWAQAPAVIAGVLVLIAVAYRDELRKTTVIMYDLDEVAVAEYEKLIGAVKTVGNAHRLWHVSSSATVLDRKYHAGASSSIRRAPTVAAVSSPSFVKCNVDVPTIGVGRQKLHFFPDRLLVFDSGAVGAVSYAQLEVECSSTHFIEEQGVPEDSRVVGRTWRYVNKSGGPDKRFKDNREIPICEYGEIRFRSATGLDELLQVSRVGTGEELRRHLLDLLRGPHRLTEVSQRSRLH